MKNLILLICCCTFPFVSFSQSDGLFQMKKTETNTLKIDTKYTSDSYIPFNGISSISSLSISGKIKLSDYPSLIRIILITEDHEYLVMEAFLLINDKKEFSFNKYCDETSLIDNEKPLALIIVVTNAEIELNKIHFSEEKLSDIEKSNLKDFKNIDKEKIAKYNSEKINQNNYKTNKNWIAGITEISMLSFEEKKKLWGANNNYLSGGLEYYIDGIFSFEDFNPNENSILKSAASSTYVSKFDWRNRHGQNWNTSIKDQTNNCGACYAFAVVAVAEALINIYHNNSSIDLNLSEQELVSCDGDNLGCSGGSMLESWEYFRSDGVVNESCFPYTASDAPCSNKGSNPTEIVEATIGFTTVYSSQGFDATKSALINYGPLASGIIFPGGGHSMQLSGYNTIEVGDVIRYLDGSSYGKDTLIQAGNSLIGQTYWIFKNSYGTGTANGGYMYFFTNSPFTSSRPLGLETTIVSHTRNYTDNDNDGYYVWGLGSKPDVDILECTPDQQDGDDSNPNIGPIDAYGNCIPISIPYTPPSHEISSTETWQGTFTECGNVVVKNSGNLTINGATVNLEGSAEFSVETGGILNFNSGTIQ